MLKTFEIRNFRCFKHQRIDSLERLNLIAGKNNTGKTSFLEAVFLHIGPNNPDLPLRINFFRGIEIFPAEPEELWGSLFFDKNTEATIELRSTDQSDKSNTLNITLEESEESELTPPAISTATSGTTTTLTTTIEPQMTLFKRSRGLILTYINGSGQTVVSRAFVGPQGEIRARPSGTKHKFPGVFLPARVRFLPADASRFSKLDRKGQTQHLLSTMQLLEPRLKRLAVLFTGGLPLINGDIGLTELIPIPMMGEGMVRLLSILLAIYDSRDGIVLIDEIENGLHYAVMPKVWQAIAVAARESNTQVFATTHSWECVVAAHQSFSASETYDFLYHRFNFVRGEIKVVTYDQKKLDTAVRTGLEVR
jgi:hypothetical protein